MSYQLPQELQTRKLNSLPEDLRAHAEELIAKKFNIGEVLDGGSRDNDFFDPSRIARPPQNAVQLTIRFSNGKLFRLVQIISSHLMGLRSYDQSTMYGEPVGPRPIFIEYAKRLAEQIRAQERKYGMARDIEAELNGYREVQISSIEHLAQFLNDHFRKERYDRYY